MKIKQTVYEPIPTGEYPATITEIVDEDGQYGPQLKVKFELVAPEDVAGRTLLGWVSAKFSNKSKLYQWVQAAMFGGGAIPRDYDFDSDALLGKTVKLVVVVKSKDDGSEYNKVDAVKALGRKSAPRPTTAAPVRRPDPIPEEPPDDDPYVSAMYPEAAEAEDDAVEYA